MKMDEEGEKERGEERKESGRETERKRERERKKGGRNHTKRARWVRALGKEGRGDGDVERGERRKKP